MSLCVRACVKGISKINIKVVFSAGACDLLLEGQQGALPDIKRAANAQITNQGYSVTTYGISSKNDWHASSITSNLQGGLDYVLVSFL